MRRIGILLPATADDAEFQAWVGVVPAGAAGWPDDCATCRSQPRWAGAPTYSPSQSRGGVGRARARRYPGPWHEERGAVWRRHTPGHRVPGRRRSCSVLASSITWHGRSATPQALWFGVRHGRRIPGTAQGDRAGRDASPVLLDTANRPGSPCWCDQAIAPSFRVEVTSVNIRDEGEIERAIAAFGVPRCRPVVTPSGSTLRHRDLIVALAHDISCRSLLRTLLCRRRGLGLLWGRLSTSIGKRPATSITSSR